MGRGDGHIANVLNAIERYVFKRFRMVGFMLCTFWHNKNVVFFLSFNNNQEGMEGWYVMPP